MCFQSITRSHELNKRPRIKGAGLDFSRNVDIWVVDAILHFLQFLGLSCLTWNQRSSEINHRQEMKFGTSYLKLSEILKILKILKFESDHVCYKGALH